MCVCVCTQSQTYISISGYLPGHMNSLVGTLVFVWWVTYLAVPKRVRLRAKLGQATEGVLVHAVCICMEGSCSEEAEALCAGTEL